MNINSRNIYIIYIFLYLSLLVGFYFNENFGAGYLVDYLFHKDISVFFDEEFKLERDPNSRSWPNWLSKIE